VLELICTQGVGHRVGRDGQKEQARLLLFYIAAAHGVALIQNGTLFDAVSITTQARFRHLSIPLGQKFQPEVKRLCLTNRHTIGLTRTKPVCYRLVSLCAVNSRNVRRTFKCLSASRCQCLASTGAHRPHPRPRPAPPTAARDVRRHPA